MDTEQALMHAGGWGRYQKILYVMVFLSGVLSAYIALHFTLSNYEPGHRCRLPEEINDTNAKYNDSGMQSFIPKEGDKSGKLQWSECQMYLLNDSAQNQTKHRSNTTSCTQGYVYNQEVNQRTAVSEFSMVCEDGWKAPVAISMYQVGVGIGSLLVTFADRFGRRPVYLLSCVCNILTTIFVATSWNMYVYMIANIFAGVFSQVLYCVAFILATEMTDASWRNFMAASSMYSFSIGYCMVAFVGYFLQNWRWYLGSASVVAFIFYLPSVWLFFESPHWLMQKGQSKDAMKVLKQVAKINGKEKDFELLVRSSIQRGGGELFVKIESPATSLVETVKILFRSGIGIRCFVVAYSWFVSSLVYYSIAYYSTSFSQDRFLNILYSGLAELPAYSCGFYAANVIGRPRSMFGFMMIMGLSSLVLPFIPEHVWIVKTALSVVGKAAVAAAFYLVYLVETEIVPTLQRSSYMSVCAASSATGSFLAHYLMLTRKLQKSLPNLIMSGLAIIAGVLSIRYLPETRGIPLPDTVAEARRNRRTYGINLLKHFNTEQPMEMRNSERNEEQVP